MTWYTECMPRQKKTTNINIIELARFHAFVMTILGLGAGILYSVGGAVYDYNTTGLNTGTALAFLALIGMPLLFGTLGVIVGLIEGIIFNIFAPMVKGMKVEF